METSPLLDFLKQNRPSFRVYTTVALSGWLEGHEKQLSYRSVREHDKIDRILTMDTLLSNKTAINDEYDLVMLAPGPWKPCRLRDDVWRNKSFRIHVLFAGSIISEPDPCKLEDVFKEWNTRVIVVREPRSLSKLQLLSKSYLNAYDPILSMSGDLTHTFRYSTATFEYWNQIYRDTTKYPSNVSIIFPRANNAEQSISFKSRSVVLETWDKDDSNSSVTVPSNQVIFATSSAIEDSTVFQDWMYKYYDRFKQHQFVICDTVEQLFGLISTAQHVYTDRYHPGVAAHVLGVDFSILRYEEERDKLIGLRDLVYKEKHSAESIRDSFNTKAFAILDDALEKAALKKKRGQ
ncbi:polysaccharide pyruvyl transferase [Nitzschia inconspicua]|uniref:Polysaccharide pyruvyl transferase n=1 Tax=Nitzschia inconspicua TaxID=303405 RepID=A0A9K3LSQ5_9STRA|nr:polysaccharide pyruvyl transferase [Nitzschia inconspicua]